MRLTSHQYGKSRVRVMKILRDGATHTVKEIDVAVRLRGDFESSYTSGDNSKVVATDTMKNTVNALAHEHLGLETERFAITLAKHFISKYPQVTRAIVDISERVWQPMGSAGKPHPHSFSNQQNARPLTRANATAGNCTLQSGIADLLILKSTGSGFAGFPRDEYTTLPETSDRIMATSLEATWDWSEASSDFRAANASILAALLTPFAENFSPSVQTTLFQMGEHALAACPQIYQVHLSAPNKHCLLVDLAPFGIANRNVLFVPTDEPHGQIEATVARV